jgi:transcriptional regulator with XRE-family HTH domain
METSDSIGRRLREERERVKLNQTDFAALAGATRQTQSNYEKGERVPDALYLAQIAMCVGADIQYILTGVPSSKRPVSKRELLPEPEPPEETRDRLTPKEAALLDNYRNSPAQGQRALEVTAAALAQPEGQGRVNEGI